MRGGRESRGNSESRGSKETEGCIECKVGTENIKMRESEREVRG